MDNAAARTEAAPQAPTPLRASVCVNVIVALSLALWGLVFLCILRLG